VDLRAGISGFGPQIGSGIRPQVFVWLTCPGHWAVRRIAYPALRYAPCWAVMTRPPGLEFVIPRFSLGECVCIQPGDANAER
jgi:hypothetical protein